MRMFFDQSNIDPTMGYGDDGNDTRDLAEAVVYAYTADELEERIPEWFHKGDNICLVSDQFWTDSIDFMTDAEFEDCWEQIVTDKSVYRLVLAYLIARKDLVWDSFLDYYADREEAAYESLH